MDVDSIVAKAKALGPEGLKETGTSDRALSLPEVQKNVRKDEPNYGSTLMCVFFRPASPSGEDTVAFLKEKVPGVRVEFITDSTLLTDVRANGGLSQVVID